MSKTPSLARLVADTLSADYFVAKGDAPAAVTARFEPGGKLPLLLITGDNASGKSLFSRVFCAAAKQLHKLDAMRVGMDTRATGGVQRAFIFSGSEDEDSTGVLSVNAVLTGLRTCRKREDPHILVLDEPDVGLSEEYSGALGARIAAFAADWPAATRALAIVTHSRALVRPFAALKPHHLRVGDELSLAQWLDRPVRAHPPEALETLVSGSHARYRDVVRVRAARKTRNGAARD